MYRVVVGRHNFRANCWLYRRTLLRHCMFKSIVYWMQESWLGVAGREIYWVFPAAEIVHFFGLCLLMGAILVVDLRLLGFARRLPLQASLQLIPVALAGIIINIASGIVFLCAYPENYWPNTAFWLKLAAFLIACCNALWFKWMEAPKVAALADNADVANSTKVVAFFSLITWIVVIVIGRFLPFVSVSTS